MEFYSSQGPSLFPSIFHITDIKLTYFPWGADGWDCWQNVEQKAGKKKSQDGSCTKCNRKRSREGRWDHPQHGAVNSFALMSIPGSETKEWCDRWCDGTGLGFETFVRSEGFTEWKSGAARVPGVHRQWQWHRFQRVPPWGNAAAKVRLSSSQSKAEPAWHLGRLWLSEMTFFKTDTFPLVTSTGAQERRDICCLKTVWLLPHKGGSKSASEALADHLSNLAKSPCHLSSSAELLTQVTPFPFSPLLSAARSARAATLAPKRGD